MQKQILGQRINDVKSFCESNRILLKDVALKTGIKYISMMNAMGQLSISSARVETIELAAIKLAEERQQKIAEEVKLFKSKVKSFHNVASL